MYEARHYDHNRVLTPDRDMLETIEDMQTKLHEHGWFHLPSAGAQNFFGLTAVLGEIIHRTDVVVKSESRGLVTSTQSLDFHTDHSKAEYIAWLCVQPDEEGGETILADARKAFHLLDSGDQKTLETVMLKEHDMFKNDQLQSPLVSMINGRPKFYYSFWLVDKNMSDEHRKAFDAFRRAVATIPFHEFKLRCNDILIVDNSFILHGRRTIKDSSRHLKRLWIRSTFNSQIRGENYANANYRRQQH